MSYCFSIAACICGFISSGFWFYASQMQFKKDNVVHDKRVGDTSITLGAEDGEDHFIMKGVPVVDAVDMHKYMKQNGRINAMAAGFTGLASLFSALSILLH